MLSENSAALSAYLMEKGLLSPGETVTIHPLSGGVSCRTILVRRSRGKDFVVKQALAKLKVQEDWFSDPARIHIEAAAMRALQDLTPAGSVPRLLFEDEAHHLLAMEAVPQPHDNWKTLLLSGKVEPDHFRQFALILAGIHGVSFQRAKYHKEFSDRSFFESLRLEPYYEFTASQAPEAADFLHRLIADCRAVQLSLVHGDFSPKNVLVYQDRLILLDHEVMHFGDGAFDIGFSMTHFLSKARHVAGRREKFLDAARYYWRVYTDHFPVDEAWEGRAVRHTIACMLARVRGKSPLEYLDEEERRGQEEWCLSRMRSCPLKMEALIY